MRIAEAEVEEVRFGADELDMLVKYLGNLVRVSCVRGLGCEVFQKGPWDLKGLSATGRMPVLGGGDRMIVGGNTEDVKLMYAEPVYSF